MSVKKSYSPSFKAKVALEAISANKVELNKCEASCHEEVKLTKAKYLSKRWGSPQLYKVKGVMATFP